MFVKLLMCLFARKVEIVDVCNFFAQIVKNVNVRLFARLNLGTPRANQSWKKISSR